MSSVIELFRRGFVPALLLLSLPLSTLGQGQLPGVDAKWRHFQSENFELYSRNPEGESRELLHNLELAHAIFFEVYDFKPVRALPITIYFFSRDRHFDGYKPEAYRNLEKIGTYYHAEFDRGILTVAPLPSYEAAQKLAFGSYTFHLFRLLGSQPPAWYRLGMAGIFRNLVINRKTIELGRPDGWQVGRLQQAKLIPVDVLFGSDHQATSFQSDEGNLLFHDQSWSLVHYLYFGSQQLPREGINTFVNFALHQGSPYDADKTRQVFAQNLGITYEDLDQALQRYFRGGKYGYSERPRPVLPAAKSYAMRSVPVSEITLRLAELALRVNHSALGKLTLLTAAEPGAETVRIQEALGSAAAGEGDWDLAAKHWDEAIAAGSTNPAVVDELLQYESRKRFYRFDLYYRLPDAVEDKLRNLLAQSIARTPSQTTVYEIMAWVEATAATPQIPNVNLVQALYPRLREQPRTLLALAVIRLRLGDKPGAANLLDILDQGTQDNWIRSASEHVRAALEGRPVDQTKLPAAKTPAGPFTFPHGLSKPQ